VHDQLLLVRDEDCDSVLLGEKLEGTLGKLGTFFDLLEGGEVKGGAEFLKREVEVLGFLLDLVT
jgi:hypothetical protein